MANPKNGQGANESPAAVAAANGAVGSARQAETATKVTASVADDKGLIGTIQKNRASEVRVSLTEFKGYQLVDVRVWAKPFGTEGGDTRATREGVSLGIAKLPELIRTLQAAWTEAKAKGLVGEA